MAPFRGFPDGFALGPPLQTAHSLPKGMATQKTLSTRAPHEIANESTLIAQERFALSETLLKFGFEARGDADAIRDDDHRQGLLHRQWFVADISIFMEAWQTRGFLTNSPSAEKIRATPLRFTPLRFTLFRYNGLIPYGGHGWRYSSSESSPREETWGAA